MEEQAVANWSGAEGNVNLLHGLCQWSSGIISHLLTFYTVSKASFSSDPKQEVAQTPTDRDRLFMGHVARCLYGGKQYGYITVS